LDDGAWGRGIAAGLVTEFDNQSIADIGACARALVAVNAARAQPHKNFLLGIQIDRLTDIALSGRKIAQISIAGQADKSQNYKNNYKFEYSQHCHSAFIALFLPRPLVGCAPRSVRMRVAPHGAVWCDCIWSFAEDHAIQGRK